MKFAPILFIATSLAVTLFILSKMMAGYDWFLLWVLLPLLYPLLISIFQLAGKIKTQVIPISGAITSLACLPFYIEAYEHHGLDAQVGLIFAVMPVYQIIGLIVLATIGYMTRHYNSSR